LKNPALFSSTKTSLYLAQKFARGNSQSSTDHFVRFRGRWREMDREGRTFKTGGQEIKDNRKKENGGGKSR